jgi:hypothetical protein
MLLVCCQSACCLHTCSVQGHQQQRVKVCLTRCLLLLLLLLLQVVKLEKKEAQLAGAV